MRDGRDVDGVRRAARRRASGLDLPRPVVENDDRDAAVKRPRAHHHPFGARTGMSFQNTNDIEEALRSPRVSVRELYQMFDQRLPVPLSGAAARKAGGGAHAGATAPDGARQIPWLQADVDLVKRFVERALEREEFRLVCDVAREAVEYWHGRAPDAQVPALVRIRMTHARALTRLGYTRLARREIEPCAQKSYQPVIYYKLRADLLRLLGEILREESQHAASRAERFRTRDESLDFFRQSLALEPDSVETMSVAAGMALVLSEPGDAYRAEAHDRANATLAAVAKHEQADGPTTNTARARAAAHAILGDVDRALAAYQEFSRTPGVPTRDLADARYYSRFMAEAIGKPPDTFAAAFPKLQLVVFAGHAPDRPGSHQPSRFPPELVEPVRAAMRDRLRELGVRAAMTSAAAGGDLLFAEAARELGAAVHLVLPWSPDEFRRTSVRGFDAGHDQPFWETMFKDALTEATTVRELGQMHEPSSTVGWDYTMEVTAGLALQTARVSRLDLQPLVLWDRQPVGGTYTFHKFWRDQLRQTPVCVDLPRLHGGAATAAPAQAPAPTAPPAPTADPAYSAYAAADYAASADDRCERRTMQQQVKSMLFADIVGYSKLTERVIPDFVATFMERVSQLAAGSAHAPRSVNTWGDAVYAIFDFAEDAGQFALELTRMIQDNEKEWIAKKLCWEEREPATETTPERIRQVPLNVRVGLHTGPVFIHYDPVVRRLSFTGAHVNRAARIEPVTPPGEVYTSEEFAAMAELGTQIERRRRRPVSVGPVEEAEASDAIADDGQSGQTFVCEYAGTMPLAKGYPGRFRIYRLLPKRVLALEELARAAHAAFRKAAEQTALEAASKGEKPPPQDPASLVPWDELSDDLKEANFAQVADIPVKLRMLGYELAPNAGLDPLDIRITPEQLEVLSRREHDRWADDRKRRGWTYAPVRDNAKKHHPCLIPWEDLPEVEKEKDRAVVRQLAEQVARAKFRVRRAP